MEYDILDFLSAIIHMANENLYRMEVLRGYCEYLEGDELSSGMAESLLSDICTRQKELIKKIDNDTTRIGANML